MRAYGSAYVSVCVPMGARVCLWERVCAYGSAYVGLWERVHAYGTRGVKQKGCVCVCVCV